MPPSRPQPLVSVIVPAWNAQGTLGETLRSAAAQTCRDLEIIIVDDGSTDDTAAIAAEFCASDPRARLIRQENRGVAAARNRAIDDARGDYIAPLDADDLWHPEKIERQLRTFADSPPRVGLVYCWYRMIDEHGEVTAPPWAPMFEGSVFCEHLQCNFGTGSSPLMRRRALGDLRYSSELGDAGNQGCEDWLLQLNIAAKHEIACTRAFLLGYRQSPAAMSSDKERMIRSHIQMYEIVRRDFPGRESRTVERELARWRGQLVLRRPSLRRWYDAAVAFARRLRRPPADDGAIGAPFLSLSPDA
jgi:glycosyltransferase involved in cell wall biosynthesis